MSFLRPQTALSPFLIYSMRETTRKRCPSDMLADGARPTNTWRICGHKVDGSPSRGCTCTWTNQWRYPTNKTIAEAKERLGMTEDAERED
jgi:hypothetical protein